MTDMKLEFEAMRNRLDMMEAEMNSKYDPGISPPEWLWKDGQQQRFIRDMPTDQGQLHFLVCAGLGDFAWVWSKLWKLSEERDVTFWFPNDDVKRVKPYCEMIGAKHGFTDVDTGTVLSFPGEFIEEDLKDGGIFYCHANKHIEAGKRIEDWFPWLPYKNPAPIEQLGTWRGGDYLCMHMGHRDYGGGNWPARLWAKAVRDIQDNFGIPVMAVGAFWDKAFADAVFEHVDPKRIPCINHSLGDCLTHILNSKGLIAVDSGLAILSKYMGVPVLQAMPSWLVNPNPTKHNPEGTHMPGAWEDPATLHPKSAWCLLDEVLDRDEKRGYSHWLKSL